MKDIQLVLFDLDGTLLPMDNDEFTKGYFKLLAAKLIPYGYDPQTLVDGVWYGTAGMVKNDGTRTNEEAFWERFIEKFGEKSREHEPIFEEFYANEFQGAKVLCGVDPDARKVVDYLKEQGIRMALATNPLFPKIATASRIEWAGFTPEEFELFTTYENSCYCKPNPDYYRDLLKKLSCDADACLMVGNDVTEDMDAAAAAGIKGYLITDNIINREGKDLAQYTHGSFADLLTYLQQN